MPSCCLCLEDAQVVGFDCWQSLREDSISTSALAWSGTMRCSYVQERLVDAGQILPAVLVCEGRDADAVRGSACAFLHSNPESE